MEQRLCEYCGETYTPRKKSLCHSQNPDCQRRHKNEQRMRAYNDAMAARPKETLVCEYCAEEFTPSRPYSKCHSQSRECALKYKAEHARPIKNASYHAHKGPPKRQLTHEYLDLWDPYGWARHHAFRSGYGLLFRLFREDCEQQLKLTLVQLGIDPFQPARVEVGHAKRALRRALYRFATEYGLVKLNGKSTPTRYNGVPLEDMDATHGVILRRWSTVWATT